MKYPCSKLSFIILLTLSVSCKKKTDIDFKFPDKPTPVTSSASNKGDLRLLFKNAAAKPEVFTVNATTGGTFTSSKGISYTIDPGIFVKPNGETAQGPVSVTVSEITKPSEMILNDMPTNAILKDTVVKKDTLVQERGAMLNSFGEIKIEAKQNEETLELKPAEEIKVIIPQAAVPEPIIPMMSVPVWDTRPIKSSQFGYNHENVPVSREITSDGLVQTGTEWIQTPQVCQQQSNTGGISLNFEVPKLNVWLNCDVLISFPRNTTVLGFFNNVFDNTDSLDNYGGRQPNMLIFKKKGDNTVIKLYNHIINAPDGKKGFLSYQNSFGIGMEGTFLAMCTKDGKYYVQKKAVTIGEPASGKSYFGVDFTLTEVSESQMLALIESMSNE